MKIIIMILCLCIVFVLANYILLKKQTRNLSAQLGQHINGTSEKMLDLSLIDHDLEHFASQLNTYYTKQRRVIAEALQHEECQKESIANISHDLRTPLTIIIGHLQLLQTTTQLTAEQTNRVNTILRKAFRMKDLIGAFYELSILDTDHSLPQLEIVNFSNLLMDFISENAPQFYKKQIHPDIYISNTSVILWTNANLLERILQNLLSNVIRYTTGEIKWNHPCFYL